MKEMHGGRCVGRDEELPACSKTTIVPALLQVHHLRSSLNPVLFNFYGGIITWHSWLNHWPMVMEISRVSFLPGVREWTGEFPTLASSLISLATNLYPEGLSKNPLISINSDVKVLIVNDKRLLTPLCSYHLENPKGFSSSEPEMTKIQNIFLTKSHSTTGCFSQACLSTSPQSLPFHFVFCQAQFTHTWPWSPLNFWPQVQTCRDIDPQDFWK